MRECPGAFKEVLWAAGKASSMNADVCAGSQIYIVKEINVIKEEKYEVQTIQKNNISDTGSDNGNHRSEHGIIL